MQMGGKTVVELRAAAKAKGCVGYSRHRKADLIEFLKTCEPPARKPAPRKRKRAASQISSMTVTELRAAAKAKGCVGYSRLRKAELTEFLRTCEAPGKRKPAGRKRKPRATVPPPSQTSSMTLVELRAAAKAKGCVGHSRRRKADLIEFLKICEPPVRKLVKPKKPAKSKNARGPKKVSRLGCINQVLIDEGLQFDRFLGKGTQGEVLLGCRGPAFSICDVAVKISKNEGGGFGLEVEIAKEAAELGIGPAVKFSGSCGQRKDKFYYMGMTYLEGQTLTEWFYDHYEDKDYFKKSKIIANEIWGANAELMENNIFQSDIKGENIIVDKNGRVWIIDYGVATRDLPKKHWDRDIRLLEGLMWRSLYTPSQYGTFVPKMKPLGRAACLKRKSTIATRARIFQGWSEEKIRNPPF